MPLQAIEKLTGKTPEKAVEREKANFKIQKSEKRGSTHLLKQINMFGRLLKGKTWGEK